MSIFFLLNYLIIVIIINDKIGRGFMSKEELIKEVETILSEKNINQEGKEYLGDTFLFIYDNYDVNDLNESREDYIKRFLGILKELEELKVLGLEDIGGAEVRTFRESAFDEAGKTVYFGEEDGVFKPIQKIVSCSCDGITLKDKKYIYVLRNNNRDIVFRTLHHEMVHLGQGEKAYYIFNYIPFSNLFREMCEEGEAVFNESFLGYSPNDQVVEELERDNQILKFNTGGATPFFGVIYQMLGLIFGFQEMESLGQLKKEEDSLNILKKKWSSELVDCVYAHVAFLVHNYNVWYGDKKYNEMHYNIDFLLYEEYLNKELSKCLSEMFNFNIQVRRPNLLVVPNNDLKQLLARKKELEDRHLLDTLRRVFDESTLECSWNYLCDIVSTRLQEVMVSQDYKEEVYRKIFERVLSCVQVKKRERR